ncbi:MAG: lipocalin-like domain-containing protein [Hyphomicrobiaceae bacterium]|nr:lipocalin-like domain-containing protein [Hyphomicrobiaceae bacterium]
MIRKICLAVTASTLASGAIAQTAEELSGVWTVVKIENVAADGTRTPAFGKEPLTQLILTRDGHFSQSFIRSDIPKFASNNRTTGTPEENAAAVKGASTSFGTFSVADKVVTLKIVGSTYPNWNGATQPRPLVRFSADELVWRVPMATTGGTIETQWKRVK